MNNLAVNTGGGFGVAAIWTLMWPPAPPPAYSDGIDERGTDAVLDARPGDRLAGERSGHSAAWDFDIFDGTKYDSNLCSRFALGKVGVSAMHRASARALACASHYETDCVLANEVGLNVPAAFVCATPPPPPPAHTHTVRRAARRRRCSRACSVTAVRTACAASSIRTSSETGASGTIERFERCTLPTARPGPRCFAGRGSSKSSFCKW